MTVTTEVHKSRWTGERIARLGFLLGLGWDAKRIAQDPISLPPQITYTGRRSASASPFAPPLQRCRLDSRPTPPPIMTPRRRNAA
jgi:hypothetical protein